MPPEPLDVVDFVVNQGHGVRGLSTMGLKSVPEIFHQPPEERLDASKITSDESIPIVDVSSWDDQSVARSICEAAELHGFFQIINHRVPEEVMAEVQAAAHRFFEMPTVEKIKYKRDCVSPGSAKLGTSFSPSKEKVLEWKDYLNLQYVGEESASQSWPPICKNEALEYYKRVEEIVKKIYDVLLKGLKVESGFNESKRSLLMGMVAVNFNYYPFCPNPELTVGVGRHSDASALTVLLQDNVGGLYVRAPHDESWIHVPPKSGALVINIGDMMQVLSNGKYKSVEHKVVANPSKNRVSIAVFVNPALTQLVAPLEEVVDGARERPMYREFVYSDYLKYFFSKGHDGKATIEWAKL